MFVLVMSHPLDLIGYITHTGKTNQFYLFRNSILPEFKCLIIRKWIKLKIKLRHVMKVRTQLLVQHRLYPITLKAMKKSNTFIKSSRNI
ncbi:hypothetical protein IPC16_25770 [Pseudomonas aeruginosa]|nr:hypothetical protein IPC17_25745 [Pseudomonas aeruginosa]RQI62912.1 hypothetical protein IPC16_25770 [Pseudomonas aeruginosa]HBP6755000.1 hypothetical protein [Pseudomonas aeruginosa]